MIERPPEPSDDDALLQELRAAAAPASDEPSTQRSVAAIPGFTLVRELERGGQGVVWLARQHEPPRDVALKLLHRERPHSPLARRRFEREAELAARLHHPHVVTVYASGCSDGVAWCAFELVDGVTLDAWLRTRTPPRRARLELFSRIARAVAHAHQRGVLHRDLKPANVLVDGDGAPHVLDFGIARALAPDPLAPAASRGSVTRDGEFVGTLAYAAPEQLAADGAGVDTRTDVHALGALLFEMVTGELPYDLSGGLAAVVARIANEPPRRARDLVRSVDPELAAVIAKAVAKEPQERYATAEALADDVDHLLRGEPVAAHGHSAWYVLRKALARRRRTVVAALVALVAVTAGGFLLARERLARAQSTRTAADVRAVLLDLLEAARPDRMGGSVPLPEILEEAARRLESRLGEVGDVRAELLLTIGETYLRLQRPDDAVPHLRAALEQARRDGAPLPIARCLHALGGALGDRDEVTPLLEEALSIRERELGPASGLAAQTRSALAVNYAERYHAPDRARGESLQRQALAELVAACGDAHPEVMRARVRLGEACARRGDDVEAEALLGGTVAALAAKAPADPGLEVESLHAFASFLQARRRFDEAETLLGRALVVTRAQFGEEQVPEVLRSFARLHYARGDYVSSERVSRQALCDELTRFTRRRPELGGRIAALAARLLDAGAPPPWCDAFELLRELRGDGAYEVAGWMNGIALLCMQQERRDVARELLRGALAIHCRIWGDDCPIRKRSLALLDELESAATPDRDGLR